MKNVVRCLVVLLLGFTAFEKPAIHAQDQPQVIEIHAKRFSFTPAEITLTKGRKGDIIPHLRRRYARPGDSGPWRERDHS